MGVFLFLLSLDVTLFKQYNRRPNEMKRTNIPYSFPLCCRFEQAPILVVSVAGYFVFGDSSSTFRLAASNSRWNFFSVMSSCVCILVLVSVEGGEKKKE